MVVLKLSAIPGRTCWNSAIRGRPVGGRARLGGADSLPRLLRRCRRQPLNCRWHKQKMRHDRKIKWHAAQLHEGSSSPCRISTARAAPLRNHTKAVSIRREADTGMLPPPDSRAMTLKGPCQMTQTVTGLYLRKGSDADSQAPALKLYSRRRAPQIGTVIKIARDLSWRHSIAETKRRFKVARALRKQKQTLVRRGSPTPT